MTWLEGRNWNCIQSTCMLIISRKNRKFLWVEQALLDFTFECKNLEVSIFGRSCGFHRLFVDNKSILRNCDLNSFSRYSFFSINWKTLIEASGEQAERKTCFFVPFRSRSSIFLTQPWMVQISSVSFRKNVRKTFMVPPVLDLLSEEKKSSSCSDKFELIVCWSRFSRDRRVCFTGSTCDF